MKFNFPLFKALATKAYKNVGGSTYPLEDVLYVFEYYFYDYERFTRRVHPNICMSQIERIIEAMPQADDEVHIFFDIDPYDYATLIDAHFKTEYNIGCGGCDYNINHFFSGNIRTLRYYEHLY